MNLINKFFTEKELKDAREKASQTGLTKKVFLIMIAVFVGLFFSAFMLFQTLFLYKVLPHGGIW